MERDFLGLSDRQVNEHVQEHQQQGLLKNQGGQFGNLMTTNFMSAVDLQKVYKPTASFLRRNQFVHAFGNANTNANTNTNTNANANANTNTNANAKQWLLRGVPLTAPNSLYPTMGSESSLSRLSILYGGTVTVFNDISPEQAQVIISLAENSKGGDETRGESSCSKISSKQVAAISVSSSSETQSESVNMNIGKMVATDATAFMDSFRADTFAPANMIPSVPQARKASLVRFLEKRKERFMSTMPYYMSKKDGFFHMN